MSIEGLLALAGILLAVYALLRPTQRVSLRLTISVWLGFTLFIFVSSLGVLLFQYTVESLENWQLLPSANICITYLTVLLPVIIVILDFIFFANGRLPKLKGGALFDKLIEVSLRENEFGELCRLLKKNKERITTVLTTENLLSLFRASLISRVMDSLSWIHLELLAEKNVFKELPRKNTAISNVVRELLSNPGSPLRAMVVVEEGGIEDHSGPTPEEWELLEATLLNPLWYFKEGTNARYYLLMVSSEKISSGELNRRYNGEIGAYDRSQGISERSHCPLYLALKTHYLAIKKVIDEIGKYPDLDDIYASDFSQTFDGVLNKSINSNIWSDHSTFTSPTPYAYLLDMILEDLERLSRKTFEIAFSTPPNANIALNQPGNIPQDLATQWAYCISLLAESPDKVSQGFINDHLGKYLVFLSELNAGGREIIFGNLPFPLPGHEKWRDLYLAELKKQFRGQTRLSKKRNLITAVGLLDTGKDYIMNARDWLIEELTEQP